MKRLIIINALAVSMIAVLAIVLGVPPAQTQALPIPTETSVSADMNPSASGATVTLTASVTTIGPATGVPTGTVEFFNVLDSIGKATLVDTDGIATASITVQFQAGLHPISVKYYGDSAYGASFSAPALSQRVLGN